MVMATLRAVSAGYGPIQILHDVSLNVNEGEIVSVIGPNGAGKSTTFKVIMGLITYLGGEVLYRGRNLLELAPDERARAGLFLAFQYPVEVAGVTNASFLRLAYNQKAEANGGEELDPLEFDDLLREKMKLLEMDYAFANRAVNQGFSGGEKKRNEIVQLAVLDPLLAVLDETDSGLDIDAMKLVADGVNGLRSPERGFLVITHYQRLLNYIVPDVVHVMADGRIVQSGGPELALEVERNGYAELLKSVA